MAEDGDKPKRDGTHRMNADAVNVDLWHVPRVVAEHLDISQARFSQIRPRIKDLEVNTTGNDGRTYTIFNVSEVARRLLANSGDNHDKQVSGLKQMQQRKGIWPTSADLNGGGGEPL